ncbi:hypothetical protein L207DRAFT_639000 [Hyaloscypha variabilis F]|uniref:Heterokaryon incompatibility domain-containing protein n=1 Tax=Hyaloscypha variabilis (strain UAMH 11265 / GT02V1 / F) TaxID=1149755 RepID=A0A2J6R4Y8_HYAVF|nr:hypothetical protein L207DRAFT_639000 [Hyaloscypha variabilis F]
MPLTSANLVGLEFDHPAFPWRLTLILETCLSFVAAGVGHGLLSLAISPVYWRSLANETMAINNFQASHSTAVMVLMIGISAWRTCSSRVSRDYRLHLRNNPSTARLLVLGLLHLGGFSLSRKVFSKRAKIFFAPLQFFAPRASYFLSGSYSLLVLWGVYRYMPELTPISSSSFTTSKVLARLIGITPQVSVSIWKENMAVALLTPVAVGGPDTRALYRYAPIVTPRTIRLLRIECRKNPLHVTSELVVVKLDDAPPFWAISYRWGSEEQPRSLRVGYRDSPGIGHIPVTSNCAAMIEALIPKGVRYLCIDAVCINQSDRQEKEHQIPLMGEIYSQASLVAGHLATDSELSVGTLVHRMIQTFAEEKPFAVDSGGSFIIYRALSEIFKHEYFQRAWIVQEMVLAKSLILIHGKDCLDLDQLIMIAKAQSKDQIIPESPGTFAPQEWMIEKLNVLGISKTQEWTAFNLSCFTFKERALVIERLRISTKEKDQQQGLTVAQIIDQNLLLNTGNPRDQPNYSLTVSDAEIFTRISWYYLRDGKRLNLFLSAGACHEFTSQETARTPGLPSWVYDFAHGPARSFRLGNWAADIERKRKVQLTCSLSLGHLRVRGTRISKVAFVATRLFSPMDLGEASNNMSSCSDFLFRTAVSIIDQAMRMVEEKVADSYPGNLARHEAYWRTMLMDCFIDQTPAPHEAESFFVTMTGAIKDHLSNPEATLLMNGQQAVLTLAKLHKDWSRERVAEGINSIRENMIRIWMPYTFVVLESGNIGWAPHDVQAGDLFCLFDGSIVPFVLRPTEGADTFSLWGDGYVQGYMPDQEPGVQKSPAEWYRIV